TTLRRPLPLERGDEVLLFHKGNPVPELVPFRLHRTLSPGRRRHPRPPSRPVQAPRRSRVGPASGILFGPRPYAPTRSGRGSTSLAGVCHNSASFVNRLALTAY